MALRISNLVGSLREWMKGALQIGALSTFLLAIEPAPASRPRVGRFGVYYGKTYETFRKMSLPLAQAFPGIPTQAPLFVLIECISTKPKTGKLQYPRADVDNLAKGPLDVMTKAAKFWADDNQVVGLAVFKRYAEPGEEPGVKIEWFEVV